MTAFRAMFPDCPAHLRDLITAGQLGLVPELTIRCDLSTPELQAGALDQCDVAVFYQLQITEGVLERHPRLKAVVYLSTGAANHIDMEAARVRNIRIRNVPGYSTRAVAEHAIGLMFCAARHIATMDRDIRQDSWRQIAGVELKGRTLGVVGLGEIGRETARLGQVLGMQVLAWNRSEKRGPWTLVSLDELLSQADIVTLHVALTPETEGFLGRSRLACMKLGAILINVSRGRLVDEDALIAALRSGRIAHASLDVFASEPLRGEHPLTQLDNVTLTSHSAWYTAEAARRLFDGGFAALRQELDLLAGQGVAS